MYIILKLSDDNYLVGQRDRDNGDTLLGPPYTIVSQHTTQDTSERVRDALIMADKYKASQGGGG